MTLTPRPQAGNYVSETVQGTGKQASADANKETVKGNTGGTLGDRAKAATNFVGDKTDQKKHDASAEANKQSI